MNEKNELESKLDQILKDLSEIKESIKRSEIHLVTNSELIARSATRGTQNGKKFGRSLDNLNPRR